MNQGLCRKLKGCAYDKSGCRCYGYHSFVCFGNSKDIEKYVTILEMDYLNTDEIKTIIRGFVKDNLNQQVDEKID